MRKHIALALLALGLGLAALGFAAAERMARTWAQSAACAIPALTAPALNRLSAIYPDMGWAAYAQGPEQLLQSAQIAGRTARAPALRYLGAAQLIAHFPLDGGRLPLAGETGACALDRATCFALFGTGAPQGGRVTVDGKILDLVGVLAVDRPLALMPAAPDDGMDRLVAGDWERLGLLAGALGAAPDPFALTGWELSGLARALCGLPLLLAGLQGAALLKARGGTWRRAARCMYLALFLLAAMALLWALPARLLPARWSDFAFYPRQWTAWRLRPSPGPDARDGLLAGDFWRVARFCALACAALWMGRRCALCEKSRW